MFNRKEIEQQILKGYTETRLQAQQDMENALSSARKNPDFDRFYKKIKELEYKIAETSYKKEDTTELEEELKRLKAKTRTMLKKLGINPNQLKMQYKCEKCKDTGFEGHEKCSCFKQKIYDEIIKESGLEVTTLNSFDNFNIDLVTEAEHKDSMLKVKGLLEVFISKFPKVAKQNILISGKTGVGKTFLLECVANEILKKGYTANFLTAFQMNNQFLKYHTCFDANKQSYLNILLEPDLLIIDDLGTEPILKNVTNEYLYLVVSERMLKSKPTLISTNLEATHIMNRYGERIFSRLFDKAKSVHFKLEGEDLRRSKRS